MRALVLLLIVACVEQPAPPPAPSPPRPAPALRPRCSVATAHVGVELEATITGICTAPAYLRGGVATLDNRALLYINQPVPCPFTLVARFAAPAADADWRYVLHLQDGALPGIMPCSGEHSEAPL
jgi:hypothetical protein